VAKGAQGGGSGRIVAHSFSHQRGGVGHPFSLPEIHVQQPHHLVVKAGNRSGQPEFRVGLHQLAAPPRVRLLRQFHCQLI
jgi:hypothetical protein